MTATFKLVYNNPTDDDPAPVAEQLENLRFLIERAFLGELAEDESFELGAYSVEEV